MVAIARSPYRVIARGALATRPRKRMICAITGISARANARLQYCAIALRFDCVLVRLHALRINFTRDCVILVVNMLSRACPIALSREGLIARLHGGTPLR